MIEIDGTKSNVNHFVTRFGYMQRKPNTKESYHFDVLDADVLFLTDILQLFNKVKGTSRVKINMC